MAKPKSKGRQLVLWPGGTSLYRKKGRSPSSFISRSGENISLRGKKLSKPSTRNKRAVQLALDFSKKKPPEEERTYFSGASGKTYKRAAKPSSQDWRNPSYPNLEESYNFLMSYYKSLED